MLIGGFDVHFIQMSLGWDAQQLLPKFPSFDATMNAQLQGMLKVDGISMRLFGMPTQGNEHRNLENTPKI